MPKDRTNDEPLTRPLGDELSAAVAEDLESFDSVQAERDSEDAFERGTDEPSSGLLSFYDRLREKIIHAVEKRREGRGGKLTEGAVRALLLVPDVFILLARLALDKSVPASTRALIGGAGFMEDLVLATAVLSQAFGGDLEPYARKHWSGSEDLRVVIRDISETAQSLLGQNLYDRLRKLMGRRGISL